MSSALPEWKPDTPYRINNIQELNPLVLGDIRAFLEQDPPRIPIKQITGFTGFTAYSAFVNADEGTSATTYGALATPGPLLDKLAPGQYLLSYGAIASAPATAGFTGIMAPTVNGGSPPAGSECVFYVAPAPQVTNGSMSAVVTLDQDGGNRIECLYLSNAGGTTINFRNRWLTALRFA